MPLTVDSYALHLYTICTAILALHLLALAVATGSVRVLTKNWLNPEDAKHPAGTFVETVHPTIARLRRAHYNALENAIPFFAIALAYCWTAPSRTLAMVYFFVFTGARLIHSIVYVLGLQPFRTLSFFVGVIATTGMAVQILRFAL